MLLLGSVILGIIVVGHTEANGGPINWWHTETLSDFHLAIVHGEIITDDLHDLHTGDDWVTHDVVSEFHEVFGDDAVVFATTLNHEHAPHLEAPGDFVTFAGSIEADKQKGIDFFEFLSGPVTIPHGSHFDTYAGHAVFRLYHDALGMDRIKAYSIVVAGVHTTGADVNLNVTITSTLTPEEIHPPGPPTEFGNYVIELNRTTGEYNLGGTLNDIGVNNILGAEIHLGGPKETGPVIFQLGSPSDWVDLGNNNSAIFTSGLVFPPDVLNAILSDSTYLLIRTQGFPQGAIRGQLRLAVVPEPPTLVLLLGLVACGLPGYLGRCRRA